MTDVFVVSRHYGCGYCNADAYEEPSENMEAVFPSLSAANRFIKQQKAINHEENCDEDFCLCERKTIHPEWTVEAVPFHEKGEKK